jgi:ADP-ribose pyrophosphatase YjhB (NUDIX family)
VPVLVDTVAWVRVENGKVLCGRPRGKAVFYVPGGKREAGESDLAALLREITEEPPVTGDRPLFSAAPGRWRAAPGPRRRRPPCH